MPSNIWKHRWKCKKGRRLISLEEMSLSFLILIKSNFKSAEIRREIRQNLNSRKNILTNVKYIFIVHEKVSEIFKILTVLG